LVYFGSYSMGMCWPSCLVLLLAAFCSSSSANQISCSELGFKETLLCSSCDDLEKFVPDKDLISDCQKCCAEEGDKNSKKNYVSAKLVVCQCPKHVSTFPAAYEFINKESKDFPNFSVEYKSGTDPILQLVDSNGSVDSLSIDHWKTENIREFLKERLPGNVN